MDIFEKDDIDLVVLNQASLPLMMNVIKSRRIIVDKYPFIRHKFESLIMRKYFDFSFLEKNILIRRYFDGPSFADSQEIV